VIAALLDHLWQSSLVALLAACLTLTVRRNAARVRFWLWFAASIKFLLPFAGLAVLGGWLSRLYPHAISAPLAIEPALRLSAPARMLPAGHESLNLLPWVMGLWALGVMAVLGLRLARWFRLRVLLADARDFASLPVRVMTSSSLLEPGLVGIIRPVVVLPYGLLEHLAPGEMASILAHEASHLLRRDNLTAAIHMLVEALFWFYPPVWLIGARLIAERERACDESVIADGHDPLLYAQGILKVCRFCMQSPLACVSGASGSDLNRRMERIMAAEAAHEMDAARGALLAGVALMVLTLPVLAGFVTAPFAVEMSRRAVQMQARLQQAMAAPLAAALSSGMAPQGDDFVAVVWAPRPVRAHVVKSAAPPQSEPAAPNSAPATVAAAAPVPMPVTIVPAAPATATDTPSPGLQQVALAIAPTGQGDPEAITCRVPQSLPGSRLPGPEVCRTNQVWASLRAHGAEISADGQTIYVSDDYQRRRILGGQDCGNIRVNGGGSTTMLRGLQVGFCS
jgi:beta-lactamase regulating signal transducer with metallopeptidase domain